MNFKDQIISLKPSEPYFVKFNALNYKIDSVEPVKLNAEFIRGHFYVYVMFVLDIMQIFW